MQKIATFLWFNDRAEEAANFYCSLFNNSKITKVSHYGEAGPGDPGSVMTVSFELDGQEFIALNGGPTYTFTPAVSLFVHCKDQAEIDDLWGKILKSGGSEVACGWITDKYGLSWQIVPDRMIELISDPDAAKSQAVMKTMMEMVKLDLAQLEKAYTSAVPVM